MYLVPEAHHVIWHPYSRQKSDYTHNKVTPASLGIPYNPAQTKGYIIRQHATLPTEKKIINGTLST